MAISRSELVFLLEGANWTESPHLCAYGLGQVAAFLPPSPLGPLLDPFCSRHRSFMDPHGFGPVWLVSGAFAAVAAWTPMARLDSALPGSPLLCSLLVSPALLPSDFFCRLVGPCRRSTMVCSAAGSSFSALHTAG